MADHAKLGASSAERWMTCPGSVLLSADLPDKSSRAADEGSAAHALAETCLLTGDEPFEYLGDPCPDPEYKDWTVTEDMVEAVTVYTNHVRELTGGRITKENVEQKVSLAKFKPLSDHFAEMFGTCDLLWTQASDPVAGKLQTLHLRDYKHGAGVAVEVEDNPQLMYYALAALLELGWILYKPKTKKKFSAIKVDVVVGIVQPRKPHEDGPVRLWKTTAHDILEWGLNQLVPAVKAVDDGDQTLVTSEKGCQFCRAKGVCPELAERSMEGAMLEFGSDGKLKPEVYFEKLTPKHIVRILDAEKGILNWLKAVREHAQESLNRGEDVTGGAYKLVAGRSSRDWKDEDAAVAQLREWGYTDEQMFDLKFRSPAQAEKLVGKERKADLIELVDVNEGSPTLVPASDKRPALQRGAEADFLD